MKNKEKIYLAILNITSYEGQCADAEHVYGNLILSKRPEVTLENLTEWNIKYLGENIEITQPLTLEIAKKLDKKEGGSLYRRMFLHVQENPEDFEQDGKTNRFNTFEEVERFGILKWKELNLDCPFISLYEGERYDFEYQGKRQFTKIIQALDEQANKD